VIVCPLHWYYREYHVRHVMSEMVRRGPPTLRGHVIGDVVLLAEGTHRLRAAHRLELPIHVITRPWWRSRQALANAMIAASRRGVPMQVFT
jgi:hypothetical protein